MTIQSTTIDELENCLRHPNKVFVVYSSLGDIWGMSYAATEIFGVADMEEVQTVQASIKPHGLTLTELVSIHDYDGLKKIVALRKKQLHTASESLQQIRLEDNQYQRDLVLVEWSIITTESVAESELKDLSDNADNLIAMLACESQDSINKTISLANRIRNTESYTLQKKLCGELIELQTELRRFNQSFIDSLLSINGLLTEKLQTFNMIQFLESRSNIVAGHWDATPYLLGKYIPEYVKADLQKVECLLGMLMRMFDSVPVNSSELSASYEIGVDKKEHLNLLLSFNCNENKSDTQVNSALKNMINSMLKRPLFVSAQILAAKLGGECGIYLTENDTVNASIKFAIKRVKNASRRQNSEFLDGENIIFIGGNDTILRRQLSRWGAKVMRFKNIELAATYLNYATDTIRLCFIHLENDKIKVTREGIELIEQKCKHVLAFSNYRDKEIRDGIIYQPLKYRAAQLANLICLLLETEFAYPNINKSSQGQASAAIAEAESILLIGPNTRLREARENSLIDEGYTVDSSETGMDAILQLTFNQYEVIFIEGKHAEFSDFALIRYLHRFIDIEKNASVVLMGYKKNLELNQWAEKNSLHLEMVDPLMPEQMVEAVEILLNSKSVVDQRSGGLLDSITKIIDHEESENFSDVHLLDTSVLDSIAKDTSEETRRAMIDMFIEESLVCLNQIAKCGESGDLKLLLEHASSLGGSSRTFGCEALYKLTREMEEKREQEQEDECQKLASSLPVIFLKSQQSLYDYCNRMDAKR